MKCFYHAGVDAIGLCSSCSKGLCAQCATNLDRAIACKDRCEVEVRRLLDLRDYNYTVPQMTRKILDRTKSTYIRGGLYSLLTGVLFIGWGYLQGITFLTVLGVLGIVFAAVQMIGAARRPPTQDQFRLCAYCGYNLTGNTTGKCPECGARA